MPKRSLLIGVDIGGTKTAIVASLKPPAIIDRIEFQTRPERGAEPALGLIKKAIDDLLCKHRLKHAAIRAIGVSCGGPLDRLRGMIQAPPNLSTSVDIPIKAILEEEFATECRVENDANAGPSPSIVLARGGGART